MLISIHHKYFQIIKSTALTHPASIFANNSQCTSVSTLKMISSSDAAMKKNVDDITTFQESQEGKISVEHLNKEGIVSS